MNRDYGKRGYADGGEIREGENANIDNDTRSRAMAMIERLNKGKDADSEPAKPMPRRNANRKMPDTATDTGDESDRLAKRKPAGMTREYMRSQGIPIEGEPAPSGRPRSTAERFADEAVDNGVKALGAVAGGAAAIKAGKTVVGKLVGRYKDLKQADDIVAAGAKRARDARAATARAREEAIFEGGMKDGGLVGHGDFRYGKKG